MRNGIVSGLLAVLVWAYAARAQNPATPAGTSLPPSDPREPMPPVPPVPPAPAPANTSGRPATLSAPSAPTQWSPAPVAVPHPFLDLPPLPPLPAVPPPLPLPDSVREGQTSALPTGRSVPAATPARPAPTPPSSASVLPAVYASPPIAPGSEPPPPDPVTPVTATTTEPIAPRLDKAAADIGTRLPNAPTTPVDAPNPLPPGRPTMLPGPVAGPVQAGTDDPPFWDLNSPRVWQTGPCVTCVTDEPRFWGGAEYLLWFYRAGHAPPLVMSESAAASTSAFNPARAQVLFPTNGFNDGPASGVRLTAGMWLFGDQRWGVEGVYFWLPEERSVDEFNSSSATVLGRPFYNVVTRAPALLPLSSPGLADGTSRVESKIDLQGGELNAVLRHGRELWFDVSFLAGFRYLRMTEGLKIADHWDAPAYRASLDSFDQFKTYNNFYGGQIGMRIAYTSNRWLATLTTKLAYGGVQQDIHVDGATHVTSPTSGSQTRPGGTLTAVTNIGDYWRTIDALVPEVTLNVGYKVRDNVTFFVGYNFLAITDVVRPGSQIDTGVNPANLPFINSPGQSTAQRPGLLLRGDSFWAQGLNFGVSVVY